MISYRDGDAKAFETLYERHKDSLYRYLRRQCRDPGAADDLFQDVWINLIRARGRYRVEAKFATFLYRIAHNRIIDHHRSAARRWQVSESDAEAIDAIPAGPEGEPEQRIDLERRYSRLRALLAELPHDQREAFLLHEEAGFTLGEIADVTGVGRETAKSRLRYAFAKLRRGMRGEK